MTTTVTLPNGFTPRPYQRRFMAAMDSGKRRAMWVVHRRGGKDLTALHQTAKMMHRRRGVYWHVFPTAEQAKKAIWEGFTSTGERIMEQVFPRAIRSTPREFLPSGEMVVTLKCGSIWRLMGSDKMEVVGAGPVGVTFSEFALAKPKTWDLVRPMLAENGGWAVFITTPRGNNHAKKLFDAAKGNPDWFCELQTLFDTRAYDPERTMAEERSSGMPEALIRQEYLCDWTAANVGAVWGDLIEALDKRAATGEDFATPGDGVFTSWDLGISDSTAIWWWRVSGQGVEALDYYEAHGQPLSHFVDVVRDRAEQHGWRYVKHWLPHDARARTLATGTSILEQLSDATALGRERVALGPALSLMDGIQAARWLLQREGTRFHARCADGLEALRAYRYAYDEDRKTFSDKPLHDWASHGADAWRYVAVVARHSELLTRPPPTPKALPPVRAPDSFSLEDIWDTAPSRGGGRL